MNKHVVLLDRLIGTIWAHFVCLNTDVKSQPPLRRGLVLQRFASLF